MLYLQQQEVPPMKLQPAVIIAGAEILGAIAEVLTAALDGKPETKPDLPKFISRILAALAALKTK